MILGPDPCMTLPRRQEHVGRTIHVDAATMSADETLNVDQAATLLHAENETVMQFARRGELPGTRIGKSWVFIREDVLTFLRLRIAQDTLERRHQHAKSPLAIAMERPKRKRHTELPVLPALPKSRN